MRKLLVLLMRISKKKEKKLKEQKKTINQFMGATAICKDRKVQTATL